MILDTTLTPELTEQVNQTTIDIRFNVRDSVDDRELLAAARFNQPIPQYFGYETLDGKKVIEWTQIRKLDPNDDTDRRVIRRYHKETR
jgi:hypothetical protein